MRPVLLVLAVSLGACADRTRIEDGARMNGVVQLKDWFTSFYVVPTDVGALLVDAGFRTGAATKALDGEGVALDEVTDVFLTHGHGDHLGLLPELSGARVHGLATEAALVEEESDGEAAIDALVTDGEVLDVDGVTVEVFAVPGHTAGTAVYLIDGVLLLGDAAIVDRGGDLAETAAKYSDDPKQAVASVQALAQRLAPRAAEIEWLAPSHSAPLQGFGPLLAFPEG